MLLLTLHIHIYRAKIFFLLVWTKDCASRTEKKSNYKVTSKIGFSNLHSPTLRFFKNWFLARAMFSFEYCMAFSISTQIRSEKSKRWPLRANCFRLEVSVVLVPSSPRSWLRQEQGCSHFCTRFSTPQSTEAKMQNVISEWIRTMKLCVKHTGCHPDGTCAFRWPQWTFLL